LRGAYHPLGCDQYSTFLNPFSKSGDNGDGLDGKFGDEWTKVKALVIEF